MILELFILTVVLAACATGAWAWAETAIPYATLASAGLWGVVALQARNVVVFHQDGSSTTVGSEPLQWIFVGFAVLSVGVLFLWYFELYPVDEEEATYNPEPR